VQDIYRRHLQTRHFPVQEQSANQSFALFGLLKNWKMISNVWIFLRYLARFLITSTWSSFQFYYVIFRQTTTSRKVAGSIPDEIIGFFSWRNPSCRTMALGSTQPLTEMSTRNLPGSKERPARKADNLTAIFEPNVYKMWEPRRVTTLWAFTTCYRDSFTFISQMYNLEKPVNIKLRTFVEISGRLQIYYTYLCTWWRQLLIMI
jgi:hypothetical protein